MLLLLMSGADCVQQRTRAHMPHANACYQTHVPCLAVPLMILINRIIAGCTLNHVAISIAVTSVPALDARVYQQSPP